MLYFWLLTLGISAATSCTCWVFASLRLHVLHQERVDFGGRQNERVLAGAQTRLPEQELG